MKDLINKAAVLAATNAALLAVVATFIGAFSGKPGALTELLLPLSLFFSGMLMAGLLAGGDILLNWSTRSTTAVELIFARGVAWATIWTSAAAAGAGCVALLIALQTISGFA